MNESVVTVRVLSLMKVTSWKKFWKERENWHQLAAKPRTTFTLTGFQQPKPTNQARTICPFSPYRLVSNNEMVQLTFAGMPLTAVT